MIDQPGWVNCLIIVGGSMLVAAAVTLLIRRKVRQPSGESHNEVAGFIFATVGVLYAVLLALMVLALWEAYGTAERAAAQEAATVLATARYAATLPDPERREMLDQLQTYTEVVLTDEWKTMSQGTSDAADQALADVWRTSGTLQPRAAYATAETLLSDLSTARTQRILASQAALPVLFWVVLVGGSLITLAFAFLLYMENSRVHALMVALLAGMIALCLWLIFEVNHPFAGAVQVPKDAFEHALQVIEALLG
jgi:CHASE3 domain sensor protein